MLKQCCAIAMLLMTVSFTIGSVDTVGSSPDKHVYFSQTYKGPLPEGMPIPPLPPLPLLQNGVMAPGIIHSEERITSVILDLSGQNRVPGIVQSGVSRGEGFVWHAGFMPPFPGMHVMPANDYITANMIVQRLGADSPSTFPVRFFRHQMSFMTDNGPMVTYSANATIPMGDDEGSFFVFNGELFVKDHAQNNATTITYPADAEPGYNSGITMGQTDWHQAQVTGEQAALNVDLKWNNPNDSLRLMVYTPDGHVLGPYTDVSDGKTDGRINVEIDNPDGVADGSWLFKVTGTSVTGKDEYYIRTW